MKIHLAGVTSLDKDDVVLESPYVLETFYGLSEKSNIVKYLKEHRWESFMLDSGAFSAMSGTFKNSDWDGYLDRYIDFINKYEIEQYFEMDLDSVVGYPKVKEYRNRLIAGTGRDPIPVWHISRGLNDFESMCEQFDRVAIGGIVSKEISKVQYPMFTKLIRIAHKNGCKIHGLGFTSPSGLKKYHFDTVDSTSWLSANYGIIYTFTGDGLKSYHRSEGKMLIGKCSDYHNHNFKEWIKFQKYANVYL